MEAQHSPGRAWLTANCQQYSWFLHGTAVLEQQLAGELAMMSVKFW
jgi:hypothetical protein